MSPDPDPVVIGLPCQLLAPHRTWLLGQCENAGHDSLPVFLVVDGLESPWPRTA